MAVSWKKKQNSRFKKYEIVSDISSICPFFVNWLTLIEYGNKNRVSKFSVVTGSGTHKTEYQYDKDNRVKALSYDGSNGLVWKKG